MTPLLLAMVLVSAEPSAEQIALLRVFRAEFVAITPGEGKFPKAFSMGSEQRPTEQPPHQVTFDKAFQIARYEVPQNLWTAVMGSNPSKWTGPRNSVEMLSFDDAVRFCETATELMRAAKLIEQTQVIRLPSEAEWEYVARAGTTTRYSFGDDRKLLDDYAWSTHNAAGNDPPVGVKKPNPWGLYDIHGYLWEWCQDTWHENYEGAPGDGSAWTTGGKSEQRVLRGGSWKDESPSLTSSFRIGVPADKKDDAVGLRCVLSDQR